MRDLRHGRAAFPLRDLALADTCGERDKPLIPVPLHERQRVLTACLPGIGEGPAQVLETVDRRITDLEDDVALVKARLCRLAAWLHSDNGQTVVFILAHLACRRNTDAEIRHPCF